jgi:hypothetical protein
MRYDKLARKSQPAVALASSHFLDLIAARLPDVASQNGTTAGYASSICNRAVSAQKGQSRL